MIIKEIEAAISEIKSPREGKGVMQNFKYLKNEEINTSLTGFSVNTLSPGSAIGYHAHINDEEFYYILSGKGVVNDNGVEKEVGSGDLIYTPFNEKHSLENIGEEPLKFIAFIVEK